MCTQQIQHFFPSRFSVVCINCLFVCSLLFYMQFTIHKLCYFSIFMGCQFICMWSLLDLQIQKWCCLKFKLLMDSMSLISDAGDEKIAKEGRSKSWKHSYGLCRFFSSKIALKSWILPRFCWFIESSLHQFWTQIA